jgi:hypothetical protein
LPTRLAALLALCVVATGCGELGGDTKPKPRAPVVNSEDLAGFQPGSPAHAFLEWFRALQLRDTERMARYYVPSLRLSAADLERQRAAGAYAIDPLAPPVIEQVAQRGPRAILTVRFRTGSIAPNGRVDYEDQNEDRFQLRRLGGRWLLTGNRFLELVARESTDEPTPAEKQAIPKVGRRQLSRYPADSPERAFLEWFGALQRSRSATAVRYYAPGLELTERELARLRRQAAYAFDGFGPPRILGVSRRGDVASVRVGLRNYISATEFKESPATTFRLRRAGGQWLLADNGLLEILATRG